MSIKVTDTGGLIGCGVIILGVIIGVPYYFYKQHQESTRKEELATPVAKQFSNVCSADPEQKIAVEGYMGIYSSFTAEPNPTSKTQSLQLEDIYPVKPQVTGLKLEDLTSKPGQARRLRVIGNVTGADEARQYCKIYVRRIEDAVTGQVLFDY